MCGFAPFLTASESHAWHPARSAEFAHVYDSDPCELSVGVGSTRLAKKSRIDPKVRASP